jgi:hypothetical protein
MPALLALIFLTAGLAADYSSFNQDRVSSIAGTLYSVSSSLFVFIVWLWGARNTNASIADELRDKTWDQQRMSALDPWTMTWGKLFGATSFNWYGGLMCLAVMAVSGMFANKHDVLHTLLTMAVAGIMLHAALITLSLHNSQSDTRTVQRGNTNWMAIILVLFLIQLSFTFIPMFINKNEHAVVWWDMDMDRAIFMLDSTLLFAAFSVLAAWRVTCNALQVRTLPWAWPLFACVLTFYIAGFLHNSTFTQQMLIGLIVALTLSYATLFSEPATLIRWRKLRLLQSREDWRGWLEHLPLWTSTLVLSFLFAVLLMLTAGDDSGFGRNEYLQPQYGLTFALMLLRDACILLFFAFSPDNKRVVATTMLYLVVLNFLLPFLANVANLESMRYFFMPVDAARNAGSSVLVMIVHVGIAISLVNWRLRTSE